MALVSDEVLAEAEKALAALPEVLGAAAPLLASFAPEVAVAVKLVEDALPLLRHVLEALGQPDLESAKKVAQERTIKAWGQAIGP